MMEDCPAQNDISDDFYNRVVEDMAEIAKRAGVGPITPAEAHEAARNFIGFFQTLLEMEREVGQSSEG